MNAGHYFHFLRLLFAVSVLNAQPPVYLLYPGDVFFDIVAVLINVHCVIVNGSFDRRSCA
jgi:hypothetical protein